MKDDLDLFLNNLTPKEKQALAYAKRVHEGVYRKGKKNEEYIWHPIRVAFLVNKYKRSKAIEDLICAAFLHDTVEDTKDDKNMMYSDIIDMFGERVGSLVRELTSVEEYKNEVGKAKYLGVKLSGMSNWALVIKLCDRLDNISDLDNVQDEFKERYINETIHVMHTLLSNRNGRTVSNTHLIIISDILDKVLSYGEKNIIKEKTIKR